MTCYCSLFSIQMLKYNNYLFRSRSRNRRKKKKKKKMMNEEALTFWLFFFSLSFWAQTCCLCMKLIEKIKKLLISIFLTETFVRFFFLPLAKLYCVFCIRRNDNYIKIEIIILWFAYFFFLFRLTMQYAEALPRPFVLYRSNIYS